MAKISIFTLVILAAASQCAVLRFQDAPHNRVARSPCVTCGPTQEQQPLTIPSPPQPNIPSPPTVFRSQNWSGLARSSDGSQNAVFSGAAAAAAQGPQTTGEAFSLAGVNSFGTSDSSNQNVVDKSDVTQLRSSTSKVNEDSKLGYGSSYNVQNKNQRQGFNSGSEHSSSSSNNENTNIGDQAGTQQSQSLGFGSASSLAQSESFGRNTGAGVLDRGGYNDQHNKLSGISIYGNDKERQSIEVQRAHKNFDSDAQKRIYDNRNNEGVADNTAFGSHVSSSLTNGYGHNQGVGSSSSHNGYFGQNQESEQNYGSSGTSYHPPADAHQSGGYLSNTAGQQGYQGQEQLQDGFDLRGNGKEFQQRNSNQGSSQGGHGSFSHGSQGTSQDLQLQQQSQSGLSNFEDDARFSKNGGYQSQQQGFTEASKEARGNDFQSRTGSASSNTQSALKGALDLASQGLKSSQPGCATCGKGGYALSNAKSYSGSAVAVSFGG